MVLQRRQEKRKSFRYPKRRAAEVIFGAHEPPVRCVIWDISDGGARLAVARPLAELPPTFTLVLFKDNASAQRDCQVVWTDARFVGVKFV
jgi:c-di-GMP-binding flagellar brake protein YcgR